MININNNMSVDKNNRYMLFYYNIVMIINPRSIYINIYLISLPQIYC